MNVQEVRTLVAYNRWANRRLVDAAAPLEPEQLHRDVGVSFGSLHGTLLHLLWGEWRWLRFFTSGAFIDPFAPGDYPDVAALRRSWAGLEMEQDKLIAGLSDPLLSEPRSVGPHEYTLGELVYHVLNHSTYHRGQVASLLRQLGVTPPPTDYRLFLTESRYGTA